MTDCWHKKTVLSLAGAKIQKSKQNDAFILSFKWLWQPFAFSGIDEEMQKTQIDEIETLSNHYLAETP